MWKAVNYEVCGKGHEKNAIPCQDKTIYSNTNAVNIICLADGAGSAKLSHHGAEAVIKAASEFISSNFDMLINNEDGKQIKKDILNFLLNRLYMLSEELLCNLNDLASTFLLVAIKDDMFLISHIGDGVIGYLKGNELKTASKPENGEFANTTIFVTSKDALLSMKLFRGNSKDIDGFVLMSDGTAESLYHKKDATLAPILVKLMHRNAILNHKIIYEDIKLSFDSVIVNNTQDDCSIAVMSRKSKILYDYQYMTNKEKCDLLGLKCGNQTYKKQISKFNRIINELDTWKSLDQLSKSLYVKKIYLKNTLKILLDVGLITKTGDRFVKATT